jgi:hypothetical protein
MNAFAAEFGAIWAVLMRTFPALNLLQLWQRLQREAEPLRE